MAEWFSALYDINARSVILGSALLGATAGAIGCFAFLRKRALLGDALAHAALPGVVLGFLVSGGKVPIALLIGAALTAWLGALAVDMITRHSKIKEDSAIAISLSIFFAAGVVGLSLVQKTGAASQSGLANFLFGHAASLLPSDVMQFSLLAILSLIVLALFYKELKAISFDSDFARSLNFPVGRLNIVLTTLIVVAVVVGLQAVGVVLMAAMVITPPAAARLWTERLSKMIFLSAIFGMAAGIIGALISYSAPRMPTGPWIVLSATAVFLVSVLFAPKRGFISRLFTYLDVRRRTMTENILKSFYRLGEQKGNMRASLPAADLQRVRYLPASDFAKGIKKLVRDGLVEIKNGGYALTEDGYQRAARLVKLHRLWEVYLTDYIHLPSDHVHRDAEQIEHILTPELEAELEALLERPRFDPHGTPIPYPQGKIS
jgi:manganese/zinc/iron transport system permease protein